MSIARRLLWTGLFLSTMVYAELAQADVFAKKDFWSYLADQDYVFVGEITSAEALREGPKECGILHHVSVLKTIKGKSLGPTLQFVSAGDEGVGTKAIFLLSRSDSRDRKRYWAQETTCVQNRDAWYFGRWATDHVLPFAISLSRVLKTDVFEIQGDGFLDDSRFIQDNVKIIDDKWMPLFARDFHHSDGGHLVLLTVVETAVQYKRR